MSSRRKVKVKKKNRERSPPPISAAGLMAFFEEEIGGIKIRPELVLAGAVMLMVLVMLAHIGLFSF